MVQQDIGNIRISSGTHRHRNGENRDISLWGDFLCQSIYAQMSSYTEEYPCVFSITAICSTCQRVRNVEKFCQYDRRPEDFTMRGWSDTSVFIDLKAYLTICLSSNPYCRGGYCSRLWCNILYIFIVYCFHIVMFLKCVPSPYYWKPSSFTL